MLRVFAEGLDDVFIKKYLEKLGYVNDEHFTTDNTGGWTKIPLVVPKIQEYIDAGDKVVLIYDADGDYNGGGFEIRKLELEKVLKECKLSIDFFLFPNNQDDGDFETLLSQIAHTDRLGIFHCFDRYEHCVKSLETDITKFRVPLRKSRIYAYFESFDESNKSKNKEHDQKTFFYDNPKYWDLDSTNLESLKFFLKERLG